MNEIKCPYCGQEINADDVVCSHCMRDLTTKCQFCKEEIKVYDTVCPHCTTELTKPKEPKYLFPIGYLLTALWLVVNIILLYLVKACPAILEIKDKYDTYAFGPGEYGQIVLQCLVVTIVPYIIALVKAYRRSHAVICLITNCICAIIFIVCFVHFRSIYLP